MRQFHTAHLEIKKDFCEDFQTHPYECGWASEAIFYIRVEDVSGDAPVLNAAAQISADGITWVNEGSVFKPISDKGLYFIRLEHFGGWLRLDCRVSGEGARFRLLVNIALKE
jgi:hypothetical protein